MRFSFEPSDIVSEVMSFGSPTPVEVAVSGPNLADEPGSTREGASRAGEGPVAPRPQFGQALDYPTVDVDIDRERARRAAA